MKSAPQRVCLNLNKISLLAQHHNIMIQDFKIVPKALTYGKGLMMMGLDLIPF